MISHAHGNAVFPWQDFWSTARWELLFFLNFTARPWHAIGIKAPPHRLQTTFSVFAAIANRISLSIQHGPKEFVLAIYFRRVWMNKILNASTAAAVFAFPIVIRCKSRAQRTTVIDLVRICHLKNTQGSVKHRIAIFRQRAKRS